MVTCAYMITKIKQARVRKKEATQKTKSASREWLDAILFAVIAATIIRWLIFTPYTIPTGSMERTLLVGDFLVVSKLHYGVATPVTPLQIPLSHQKIWGTDIPSYLDWIQLPQYRLPALSKVKRGDVVVFNYPTELEHPVDLRSNYIKRAVGLPGDTLSIQNQQVFVNGTAEPKPDEMQFMYMIKLEGAPSERFIRQHKLYDAQLYGDGLMASLTASAAKEIEALAYVKGVERIEFPEGEKEAGVLPEAYQALPWNLDNFGPLVIPAQGMTISLTEENIALYFNTIKHYEGHDPEAVVLQNGKVVINGQPMESYTFQQDYYFMMGDNRHNSLDSRYWGFVPHDHLVGKALFTWLSLDQYESFFSKVRWERIFKGIK